ncbi:hypothetical protein BKH36_12935 [Actinomyces naeslundii]|nr:hypothetical protein BKH36_12935 [Actinomyces naeslundii]
MEGNCDAAVDGLLLQAGTQARNHQHGPPTSNFQELLEGVLRILIAGEYCIGDIGIRYFSEIESSAELSEAVFRKVRFQYLENDGSNLGITQSPRAFINIARLISARSAIFVLLTKLRAHEGCTPTACVCGIPGGRKILRTINTIQPCNNGIHSFHHHGINKEEQSPNGRYINIAFHLHRKSVAVRL